MIFPAVLQHHFPAKPDPKMPEHWDVRIQTAALPYPQLRLYANPLTVREEIPVQLSSTTDPAWLSKSGEIAAGEVGNPTGGPAFIEIVERDIPTEIIQNEPDILQFRFSGKKLFGTLNVNVKTGQGYFSPAIKASESERVSEFKVEGYDETKVGDQQLADDFRLLAAKFATMSRGGKSEFATVNDLIDFAVGVVREIRKRGKVQFHPESEAATTRELLRLVDKRLGEASLVPDVHTSSLSNLELVSLHGLVHAEWESPMLTSGWTREQRIEFHRRLLSEMTARGLEHRPRGELDGIHSAEPTAAMLHEIAQAFPTPIFLKKPFLAVVGSTAVSGRGKDLDLWVNWPAGDAEFLRVIAFRLKSMLPADMNLNLIADQAGPFTSFVPLANLKVEFIPPPQRELVQMSGKAAKKKARSGEAAQAAYSMAQASGHRKVNLQSLPIGSYRIFTHWRGRSSHKDFRFKAGPDFLEGWTITDEPAGEVKEPVSTVDEGYKWQASVPWKFRPDMDPVNKVVAVPKAHQPLPWFNMFNVVVPPGHVGATAEGEGVFTLVDEGTLTRGLDEPDFKEFFLKGDIFTGRLIFRLISTSGFDKAGTGATQWQASTNLKDQTPTILGSRQRRKTRDQQYVPAEGEKAIPPEWESKIKPEFQWWAAGLKPGDRLDRLEAAFNDLIERGLLDARKIKEASGRFLLRSHFWKGPTVIRGLPVLHYDLVFDQAGKVFQFVFDRGVDPVAETKTGHGVSGVRQEIKGNNLPPGGGSPSGWLKPVKLELPVGHPENPTKELPAFMDPADHGDFSVIEDSELVFKIALSGSELKGNFIFKRSSPNDEVWTFERSGGPGSALAKP